MLGPMGDVSALGYVIITASDLHAWQAYAEDCLGLAAAPTPGGPTECETLFLRCDERSWRLAVERGEDGGLGALGFEVAGPEALQRLVLRLEEAGVAVKEAPEVAAQRAVSRLVQLRDPSGVPVELFYGALVPKPRFVSPTGARFVTGAQGIGHVAMTVDDADETYDFYVGLLGFRLSDVLASPGIGELKFISPSPRHHSLAFGSFPGAPGVRVLHLMLEVDDLDTVGRALDHCLDNEVRIQNLLGRHTNDLMISFYSVSPSGLAIEYGYGGRIVDDATHHVGHYDAPSFWGHRRPPSAGSKTR